jgi:hypothetical protein
MAKRRKFKDEENIIDRYYDKTMLGSGADINFHMDNNMRYPEYY